MTKTLLLPSIVLYYILSVDAPSGIVLGAMAMSWLGDVLLEKSGMKWFVSGGIAFMLSHFLFMWRYVQLTDFSAVSIPVAAAVAAVYLIVAFITITCIKPGTPGGLSVPLFAYLGFNAAMNVFSFCLMLSLGVSLSGIILFTGAVMFFISDNCLFFECFHIKKPDLFLPVMGTYILGEFLIAQALILIR